MPGQEGIRLSVDGALPDGTAIVCVEADSGPIHVDRIDLARSDQRERFIAKCIELAPGLDTDQIRAMLMRRVPRRLGGSLPAAQKPAASSGRGPARTPFPLHLMPLDVQAFCRAVAQARSVDVSMVAAAVFVSLGSAIGLTRCAWDSFSRWSEPPAIWLAMVLRSGGRKSPVLDDVFGPHYKRQAGFASEHKLAMKDYQTKFDEWEGPRKQKLKAGTEGTAIPRPEQPQLKHVYTTDATQEAMAGMLAQTPRGLLVINDELAGFFGSMGRYGNGKADADRAFWLSMFRATSAKIDRASKGTTFIEKGLASIVGGVQPKILGNCFGEDSFSSGLASRFLLVMPDLHVKQYRPGPSDADVELYERLLTRLMELPQGVAAEMSAQGSVQDITIKVPFSDECRAFLSTWIPQWSEEALNSAETVEAAMSKLEGYALRFALILKTCREANGDAAPEDPIELADLEAGAELARWFRDEAIRVYRELGQNVEPGLDRKLAARVEAIRGLGGAVTVREWRQRNTRRTTDSARAELDELVQAKVAVWSERAPGPSGGAPTEECRILEERSEDRDPLPTSDGDLGDDTSDTGCGVDQGSDPPVAAEPSANGTAFGGSLNKSTDEVAGCALDTDRADAGDPGDTNRKSDSKGVPGCELRGAEANRLHRRPLDPEKVVLGGDQGPDGHCLHPTTSTAHSTNGVGPDRERARSECTPQPATHNPLEADHADTLDRREGPESDVGGPRPSAQPPLVESQSGGVRVVQAGWPLQGSKADVVPIGNVFNLGGEGPRPCFSCRSKTFWRLEDAGRGQPGDWLCARCIPPKIAEHHIQRLDVAGGVA